MTENIELVPLRSRTYSNNDTIEDYDEIKQISTDHSFSTEPLKKVLNEYDFFTELDVKTTQKTRSKKKKTKKKDKQSQLMDIINNELAAAEIPIETNVITLLDTSMERRESYLKSAPNFFEQFQKKYQHPDAEPGWSTKSASNLSPIFPRVLDNALIEPREIPVEYFESEKFDNVISNMINKEPVQTKFIDIEIKDLKCINHHQFSLEQLLAQKLLSVYSDYQGILIELKKINNDIKINRETKDNLKRGLLKISPKKDDVRFDPSVRKYTGQMIEFKKKYMDTLKKEKEILNIIVSIWSDIQMVREKSQCVKSPYLLEVSKIVMDEDDFEKEWSKAFEIEFCDLLDKEEYAFLNKYIMYKENKTEEPGESIQKLSKPKFHIDEEHLKDVAENLANDLVRKEKVYIKLKTNEKILKGGTDHVETHETDYFFKIYVDDLFVCESDHYPSKQCFDAEFTESFSVQLLPENSTITIILFENGEEVSNYKLNICEIKQNGDSCEFNKLQFVYNNIIESNAKYIGCGYSIKEIAAANKVRLKSSNVFNGNLYTTCETNVKVGWNVKINQNYEEDIYSYIEIERKIKRLMHGIDKPTVDGLKEIIEKIYEQDISNNEEMINTLNDICKCNVEDTDEFPIDDVEFVRIKLLNLRNEGEFSNIENKTIPLYASQISTEQLNCIQKSQETEFDVKNFSSDKYTEMDPIELQRLIGAKYVENLNKNLLKNLNETLLRKTYKDVVCDFRDLSIRSLFSNQANLTNISNGSRGQNLEDIISKEQEIYINIQRAFNLPDRTASILTEENVDDHGDNIAGYKVRSLRPFVKVTCQGFSEQTATAIGCHPTWNQTLKIKTKPGKPSSIYINIYDEEKMNVTENYTEDDSLQNRTMHFRCYNKWLGALEVPLLGVLTLGKIRGTFKISTPSLILGYESHTGEKVMNRSLIPEVTQLLKKESSFISLQIATKSQLGCIHRYDLPTPNNSEDDYIIKHLNTFTTEYQNDFPNRHLSLTFIDSAGKNKCVTQYLQPIPMPNYEIFPKNPKRSESAVSKSSNLSKSSSSKRSSDIEKGIEVEKESLYSNYEAKSWKKNDNPVESMINAALRYVSLIPCYEVTESHTVTLMGVELLRILNGSPLDHTILLASYFLYLGLKTFVAIGLGLPRGQSSYVLTKYDLRSRRIVLQNDQLYGRSSFSFLNRNDGFVWHVYNAITGERFELRDVGCPLKTVDFVFDNENVWVNMQSSQDCESVSFDFTKTSDWRPVFDKNIFIMKHPVIAEANLYTNMADVEQLRNLIESKIKIKIQKWRAHMKTIWNRYCSTLLREMLPQWEYWALNPSDPRPVLGQRMRQLMATYKVYGLPINMPYTSTKAVIHALKSTGMHMNDDPNAEFGLGVDVYAYPNTVVSVWVFLASVTRI